MKKSRRMGKERKKSARADEDFFIDSRGGQARRRRQAPGGQNAVARAGQADKILRANSQSGSKPREGSLSFDSSFCRWVAG